jgi:hypothetical protein
LVVEEAMVLELSLPKPGGMCYRHNLAGPRDGREQHGLKEIIVMVCKSASVQTCQGPRWPCI